MGAGGGGRDRLEVDHAEWRTKLDHFRRGGEKELQVRENYGRHGVEEIHQLAAEQDLYSKAYGKGRNTVLVVSREPLPNCRADLDAKLEGRVQHVEMSRASKAMVEDVLARLPEMPRDSGGDFYGQPPSSEPAPRQPQQQSAEAQPDVPETWEDGDVDDAPARPHAQPQPQGRSGASPAQMREKSARLLGEWQARSQSPEYMSMMEKRMRLPSYGMRDKLLADIRGNRVVVVSGETGCGKTTQVPQFVIDDMDARGEGAYCSIICTQPRRISAMSVAERVSSERCERLGQSVGYQIRLEAKRSDETRLLFCTTGVLLRRLANDGQLAGVSHIIVDEIHERGINEDFLLIILKDLLAHNPTVKVILMSATLNAARFSEYLGGCPTTHIPGFTHPVKDVFLEEVLEEIRYDIPADGGGGGGGGGGGWGGGGRGRMDRAERAKKREQAANANAGTSLDGVSLIDNIEDDDVTAGRYRGCSGRVKQSLLHWDPDKTDLNLVLATLEHICVRGEEGAVLVFLTGWDDISKLLDEAKKSRVLSDSARVRLLPLHGSMPTVNQREIFDRPPRGVRKIVVATNIAETSITIDDIVFVVDTGKAKEKTYDPVNKLACLLPTWISRASARQRRGRAGRVQAGVCYHLYPSGAHEQMNEYQLAEILRTPLEELCLQIKSLDLGMIAPFIEKALDAPPPLSVQNAINLLVAIGGLTDDGSERLTALGRHLAALPVDPRVGKMLIYASVMQCLPSVLTIAAGMAYKDPWVMPLDKKQAADEARRRFAGESCSDHIALLTAYNEWKRMPAHVARDWCWRNYLSGNTLDMMRDMRRQFLQLLETIGFVDRASSHALGGEPHGKHSEQLMLVRAVLTAGMYPNLVSVEAGKREAKWHTFDDGKVKPRPSSVNSFVRSFPSRWLVYNQKVKSSDIFIRDSSCVSDYALLLFGGALTTKGSTMSMCNGYASFSANRDVGNVVVALRAQIDAILQRKIETPGMDIDAEGAALVDAVVKLLSS